VRASGAVTCWGSNSNGQLGNGTTVSSTAPVPVSGLAGAVRVAAGLDFTCALVGTGAARCWGAGRLGQLGNSVHADSSLPVTVSDRAGSSFPPGLDGGTIAPGAWSACVALASGDLRCWGNNGYGQLGNGTTVDSAIPVAVGLPPASASHIDQINFPGI